MDKARAATRTFWRAPPVLRARRRRSTMKPALPVTSDENNLGIQQHTAAELSDLILEDFGIDPARLHRLALIRTGYGERLGEMIAVYSGTLSKSAPHLVVVFGDVDVTLAASISAKRMGLPLAHVEAGLRSHDREMPEELNRLMVDSISDLLFATTEDAVDRLIRVEGKSAAQVHWVGNPMIDALVGTLDLESGARSARDLGLEPGKFILATFHRPSNVDGVEPLRHLIGILEDACRRLPMLLPLHPRAKASLVRHGLLVEAQSVPGLHLTEPLRYREFINLAAHARLVLTDSGGLQEETSFLGVPCLTYRENTERPVTVTLGTNRLVGPLDTIPAIDECLSRLMPPVPSIPLWDGHTSQRIVKKLEAWWRCRE